MPKIKSPCFDCEKRTVGCHSTCEEYKAYSQKNKEQNELRKVAVKKRTEAMTFELGIKQKVLKRYRRKK